MRTIRCSSDTGLSFYVWKETIMQRQPILTNRDLSLFELKTRLVRNYLTFAGKNSKDFLLYISASGESYTPGAEI